MGTVRAVRASSVPLGARTTEGRLFVLSCSWLFHGLSAGQALKEGGRGSPCREVINEAVPVGEPMVPYSRDGSAHRRLSLASSTY